MLERRRRRGLLAAVLIGVTPLVSACGDDAIDDHDELPEFLELTVGAQTLRVNSSGTIIVGNSPGIGLGATAVTARFLADDGDVLNLDASEYELRVTSLTPGVVTWTAGGAFNGTVTGVAGGNAVLRFTLFHTGEQHEDWGPHGVTFAVAVP